MSPSFGREYLAFGREHLAIPGPSVIPDRVLQAMHQPSPNIFEGPFWNVIQSTKNVLKKSPAAPHRWPFMQPMVTGFGGCVGEYRSSG